MQEAAQKDIQRAFGVMQCIWHIIQQASCFASVDDMKLVMKCVITLHNMVVHERCYTKCKEGDEICEGIVVSPDKPTI